MKNCSQRDLFHQPVEPLPRDRMHGLLVRTPRPCRRCSSELAVIGPGKGPHAASLTCAECETHRGWLSHEFHRFITEIVNESGRPTEPIVLLRGRQP